MSATLPSMRSQCRTLRVRSLVSTGPCERSFSSTSITRTRRKPSFANVKAVDLRLITGREKAPNATSKPQEDQPEKQPQHQGDSKEMRRALKQFRPYSARERQLLALKYTPEQLAALEAAEMSIDPRDIVKKGRMRNDAMRIEYKDDFSKIVPLIDHPIRAPDEDVDPGIRPLSVQDTRQRFVRWFEQLATRQEQQAEAPEPLTDEEHRLRAQRAGLELGIFPGDGLTPDERRERLRRWAQEHEIHDQDEDADGSRGYVTGIDDTVEFERFVSDPNNFYFSPKNKLDSQSTVLADELPYLPDPRMRTEDESDNPHIERLALQMGMPLETVKKYRTKMLISHRVINQTRMGKIQSEYVLSIAGDGKGLLGIGQASTTEPEEAVRKSRLNAIRNMRPVMKYEDRTIFGEVEGKVGASIVKLSARPPGFGNRCQSLIFEMVRMAGIKDISARCLRSRNKMNVVKATYAALMSQKDPQEVAFARGIKLVDARKVYYQGLHATTS